MKRFSIAIILAFSMLAMFAQEEAIRVDYTGNRPTIKDFLQAYLQSLPDINDLDECDVEGMYLLENLRLAVLYQGEGIALEPNEKLEIDLKNGYACYEKRNESSLSRIEMSTGTRAMASTNCLPACDNHSTTDGIWPANMMARNSTAITMPPRQ